MSAMRHRAPAPPEYTEVVDRVERHTRSQPLLAKELLFQHWLFVIIGVSAIYALVVALDRRMPEVVPASARHEFSEERARAFLEQLTALGPRSSGSAALEVEAVKLVTERIARASAAFNATNVNRLELEVQHPTGCFDLRFLTPFTLCYHEITNILVRVGAKTPSQHAVLLNCHLDTLPDTPGATDDAVSCAIMMEIIELLSRRQTPLENDIIFMFNGAEENFLQGSHGFITQHRWRHDVRAFINLEGTGAGGREILFQAGPGDSWILETYLDNAPYPHCSVIAQEVFQSGILPSDTDFRILRDYGRLSGLDIAYHRNGWVYHTEFDTADVIDTGCIQRAGANVHAVTEALVRSPSLSQPRQRQDGAQWVFFDLVGIFTVRYKAIYGTIINYVAVAATALLVATHMARGFYTPRAMCAAGLHHTLAFGMMAIVGVGVALLVHALGLTMCWYSLPEMVFPLYIVPMLIGGCWMHSQCALGDRGARATPARTYDAIRAELVHYDTVLVYWAIVLFVMTANGLASSFYICIHVVFAGLRDPLLNLYAGWRASQGKLTLITPWTKFVAQWLCLTPVVAFSCYAISLLFDFFVPVMGRFGNVISPELLMMPLSLLTASSFVLFTSNLVYMSRPMNYFFKVAIAFWVLCFLLIATTRLGNPYKWTDDGLPRLRRIIALHSKRTIYDYNGDVNATSNGFFIQSFDYRGVEDLPEHTFLQSSSHPDCSHTHDAYCQLPYYTAIYDLMPPERTQWVPLPTAPSLPHPLEVQQLDRVEAADGASVNMSFVVRGGVDKLSLHLTPLDNHRLTHFSFTTMDRDVLGERSTYFVFMTYGHRAPDDRRFWVVLDKSAATMQSSAASPRLELVVATHQAHGRYQNSPTLLQLRSLINSRRKTPHVAVGFWRWGITMFGGTSELVSHLF